MEEVIQEPKPPAGICRESRKLWREVVANWEFTPEKLEILKQACFALTRANEAKKALKTGGLTYIDRFNQPKARPEIAVENTNRLTFYKLIKGLYLEEGIPSVEDWY